MNVLFVGAHHDDLEVAAGGTVKRWVEEGHRVFGAVLTDSTWTAPDGTRFRDAAGAERDARLAAEILGYTPLHLGFSHALDLVYTDDKVARLLGILEEHRITTVLTLSGADNLRDHRATSEIALMAARRVPRLLLARASWPRGDGHFQPCFYVDITAQFEAKLQALRCYADEYARRGPALERLARASAELYGLEAGCELAEGFEVVRYLY